MKKGESGFHTKGFTCKEASTLHIQSHLLLVWLPFFYGGGKRLKAKNKSWKHYRQSETQVVYYIERNFFAGLLSVELSKNKLSSTLFYIFFILYPSNKFIDC